MIHGYTPSDILAKIVGRGDIFAVPIAILIGVPLYSSAAWDYFHRPSPTLSKGLPIGTSLAFMMATTALSLPEMIILRKVLKDKLLILYVVILVLGIMFTGYLFNFLI